MLKISNLKTPFSSNDSPTMLCAKYLGIREKEIRSVKILKKSIDSRKKPLIFYIYNLAVSVENEERFFNSKKYPEVSKYTSDLYSFPYGGLRFDKPPVIVGAGPAGLFAALCLAEAGVKCILLERGKCVQQRKEDVERFWKTGVLSENSNVQFGEGGAGTFSDGKLVTGNKDKRIPYIFSRFVEFGAPDEIMYDAKPHVGTDILHMVVKNLRNHLISLGCEVRFQHKLERIYINGGSVCGALISSPDSDYEIEADNIILAPGNSARDTFRMMNGIGVPMSPKSFAVGVRIEHRQEDVNNAQYGEAATLGTLPASSYKLVEHVENGRTVYSFCVCPGGQVVAAASEKGGVVTNGMSYHARDGENINGGLLVSVSPSDFGDTLFGGMEFQEKLEKAAFTYGGGDYKAPAQLVGDFLKKKPSSKCGKVSPTYLPGVKYGDLREVLPDFITDSIAMALPKMERKIEGYSSPDAVLTAVETRSSCPVRIDRDENCQSKIKGLFPCGEGAGYAGGITSSAIDGIRCAEALCAASMR